RLSVWRGPGRSTDTWEMWLLKTIPPLSYSAGGDFPECLGGMDTKQDSGLLIGSGVVGDGVIQVGQHVLGDILRDNVHDILQLSGVFNDFRVAQLLAPPSLGADDLGKDALYDSYFRFVSHYNSSLIPGRRSW